MSGAERLRAAVAIGGLRDLTMVDKLTISMLCAAAYGHFINATRFGWPHVCDPEPHPQRRIL